MGAIITVHVILLGCAKAMSMSSHLATWSNFYMTSLEIKFDAYKVSYLNMLIYTHRPFLVRILSVPKTGKSLDRVPYMAEYT